jgi:hypothetical protein
MKVMKNLLHMNGVFDGWIELEDEVRRIPQVHPASLFLSYKPLGAVEALQGAISVLLGSDDTEVDPRRSAIVGNLHPGHRHKPDPGILDGSEKHLGDFLLNQIGYLVGPLAFYHLSLLPALFACPEQPFILRPFDKLRIRTNG